MTSFNYDNPAELFPNSGHSKAGAASGNLRFTNAADAIRYAVEVLRDQDIGEAILEVNGEQFDFDGLHRLYDSARYPLFRQPASIQDRLLAARQTP